MESLWSAPGGYVTGVAIGIPSNKLVIRSDRVLTSTSPHEVGHCLNLYHTFEKYYCAEAIDGSNCSLCGDFVCDTPADNGTGNVGGYSPDMTNIMSYYSFRNHFTDGQGVRMRNALANESILSQIDSNNCSIPRVNGSESICITETYVLEDTDPSAVATWSVSPNLKILSFTNTSVTVEQKNTYPNGEGYIEAQFSSDIVRKDVWVGGPKLYTYNDDGSKNYLGGGYSFPVSSSTRTITVQSETYNTTYTWDMFPTDIQWMGINNKAVFYVSTPGNYVLTVEATDPCGSQLMFFIIQIGGNNNLSIYPNPVTQGSMSVTVNSSSASSTFSGGSTTNQVKIYDLYGVERFSNSYNSNSFTINGLNFEPGNYILNVTTLDGSIIQEIIIIE